MIVEQPQEVSPLARPTKRPYAPPACISSGSAGGAVFLACTGFAVNCGPQGFPGCCLPEGSTCDELSCL